MPDRKDRIVSAFGVLVVVTMALITVWIVKTMIYYTYYL